jgi:hypothetical protein
MMPKTNLTVDEFDSGGNREDQQAARTRGGRNCRLVTVMGSAPTSVWCNLYISGSQPFESVSFAGAGFACGAFWGRTEFDQVIDPLVWFHFSLQITEMVMKIDTRKSGLLIVLNEAVCEAPCKHFLGKFQRI